MIGPALWSGHIVFGLVLVPIRLHAATERGTTPLHLVHTTDDCLGRIRYRKVCELDEEEVAEQDMGRGFETPTGIVPISNEDLDNLPIATARAVELIAVVPADRIDPRQIGAASYYLGADRAPAAAKPYVLLREVLARTAQVVVVKYAVRGDRERLGILRPLYDVLPITSTDSAGATRSATSNPVSPRRPLPSTRTNYPRPSRSSRPAASTDSTRSPTSLTTTPKPSTP